MLLTYHTAYSFPEEAELARADMCTARDAALRHAAAARHQEHLTELAQLRRELSKQAKVTLAARRDEVRRLQLAARRRLELDLAHRAALAVDAARAEEVRLAREAATQRHNTAEDKRRRATVADMFQSKHRPVSAEPDAAASQDGGAAAARRRLQVEEDAARGRLAARLALERGAVLREVEERWRQRHDGRRRRRENVAAAALERTQAVAEAKRDNQRLIAAATAAAPSAPALVAQAAGDAHRDRRALEGEAAARWPVPSGHAEPGHGVPAGAAVKTCAWATAPTAWVRRDAAAKDGGWREGAGAAERETARVMCR